MPNALNIKKRFRLRYMLKCNCFTCDEKYIDLRTRNKHLHYKINTYELVSFEDNLTIESLTVIKDVSIKEQSSCLFINEEFFQKGMSFLKNIGSKFLKLRKRIRNNNTFQKYDDQIQIDDSLVNKVSD
ncbi:hypothetical protein RCL_jg4889.t1 [Rhizophagus clarus]|uniref:Uncharacterized protein n=1 Tax=Rhizophagus clarus TaxID=94130 RepID=A0A8H3MLL8_9GLOM|nr:hypothetical protein RCL_jg4889.t1 [Rhizophagus clarus]